MITVNRYSDRITLRGHANYAEIGKDIVCSAVSVLVQTLVQSVETLTTDRIEYNMSPGKVDIKFWCLSDPSKVLIDAFFIGIKGVADSYPACVKVNEKN
ncbi:MAG: ribosomal-processing cysteine protease Prp [Clostridia bacterium]|nr:ribosomal-processing cysteine protease Prp [Clostridia bacterium]